MSGRGWKLYAITALVVIGVYQVVPDNPWFLGGWQVGIGYLGAGAIVVGVRKFPVRDRVPWWCFAVGIFGNASGIAVETYLSEVLHVYSVPSWADPFWLSLYPACALGLALMIRRRETRRNWAAMVDATTITTGLGLLAWIFVIQPAGSDSEMSTLGHAVQVAYPIGDLVLIAMTTRLLRGGGIRGAAFWWIIGSLAAFLAGDVIWVIIGNLGAAVENAPITARAIESVFLVAYTLFGVAALHPAARELNQSAQPAAPRLSGTLLLLLTAASLIAPGILAAQVFNGGVQDGPAIVIGSTTLFLLVVTRMAQLLRQVEQQALRVRELSRSDELTGLPNRRAWNDELPRALEHGRRDGAPVTVALLDLDHFKRFNDSYGHPAGDRLLKEASAAWHTVLRQVDTLARYGGEEFIVLLPHADTDQAEAVVQRILAVTPLGQTFSAGVATWDGSETSEDLIARVDAALYRAKADGRNRIVAAPVDAPQPSPLNSLPDAAPAGR
jgi:diguanylate cyclase (GGDEF)-like protein